MISPWHWPQSCPAGLPAPSTAGCPNCHSCHQAPACPQPHHRSLQQSPSASRDGACPWPRFRVRSADLRILSCSCLPPAFCCPTSLTCCASAPKRGALSALWGGNGNTGAQDRTWLSMWHQGRNVPILLVVDPKHSRFCFHSLKQKNPFRQSNPCTSRQCYWRSKVTYTVWQCQVSRLVHRSTLTNQLCFAKTHGKWTRLIASIKALTFI